MPAGVWADWLATLFLKGFIPPCPEVTFRSHSVPILYTVHRPQSEKWFSELRSRRVTLARVSAAATAGEVPGARGTDCSAGTISQCAGPKIQAAREERCSSNVGISTFVEIEEFSSSKRRLVKAPPGFHRAPCTHSALQQQMVHHHRAALWPSKPSQISVPWTCTSFKKKNREKTVLKAGLYCLEPRFTWYLLTAFPSLLFN